MSIVLRKATRDVDYQSVNSRESNAVTSSPHFFSSAAVFQ